MRHKVETHKVRQIKLFTVIRIKLYIFKQLNDWKNSAISTFEK